MESGKESGRDAEMEVTHIVLGPRNPKEEFTKRRWLKTALGDVCMQGSQGGETMVEADKEPGREKTEKHSKTSVTTFHSEGTGPSSKRLQNE